MKIGILTLHRAVNYGAVLQAYALTKKCIDLDAEAELIDYRCKFTEDYYNVFKLFLPKNWKRLSAYILQNGNLTPDKELLFSFLKRKGILSEEVYYDNKHLGLANDKYNKFIVGSDQVWNPRTAGFDKAYFLDFVYDNQKKASYAASFGISSIPVELQKIYGDLLSGFSNYSVREKTGRVIVQDLLGRCPTVNLDPTLLFEKEEWFASINYDFIRTELKKLKEYILIYTISQNENMIRYAKKISKNNNIPVLYINDRWRKTRGLINLRKINIDEWLFLFKNASVVVTDSFHGTAFSVNFERNFVTFQESFSKKSSRIVSLLEATGLKTRLFNEKSILELSDVFPINFDEANKKLYSLRNESISDLRRIIYDER